MATERAWIIGPEGVCSWYQSMCDDEQPFYSIWQGKYLKFSYSGDSVNEGEEILQSNLKMAVELQSSELLTIRLHPSNPTGVITDKTPYCASIQFRCVPVEEDALAYGRLTYGAPNAEIAKLKAEIAGLKDDRPKGIMGYLEPMLENPDVQNAIVGSLFGVLGKLLPGLFGHMVQAPGASPAQPAIPGGAAMGSMDEMTETEEAELQANLIRLEQKDPNIVKDLGKLADLAEKNPTLFNMLIAQLQNQ